jgi:lipopolysaccharide transport system ATP-binding protein
MKRQREGGKNSFWALKDVSFEVEQGESLALVGANGAGKTTILKLLAKITKPTYGSIDINGNLSALIELGAGFHPDLTGRENVYLNGTILGLSRKQINQNFDEIVDFSELEQFIDTPVKRYSSGMVVRLGFAVASQIKPAILLVDEVLAVGDASFQQKCMERIRLLIKGGTSIIFVSHNIYLIQAVCNKALYLERGLFRGIGNTKEIIDLYERDLHEKRISKFGKMNTEALDGSENLEITRVEILGDKTDSMVYSNKNPIQIRIHYNAYIAMGRVNVSVFIKRSDGLTCCMLRSKLDDFQITLAQGAGVVSLTIDPVQLITGTYYVEAWFLNETDSMGIVQRAGRSDWFAVKGTAISFTDDSGVFEPATRWEHHPRIGTAGEGLELVDVQNA